MQRYELGQTEQSAAGPYDGHETVLKMQGCDIYLDELRRSMFQEIDRGKRNTAVAGVAGIAIGWFVCGYMQQRK